MKPKALALRVLSVACLVCSVINPVAVVLGVSWYSWIALGLLFFVASDSG